ncbi:hypothetical protein PIB30_012149 [Stylosanthes scabra]|uniref:Uncharacterized protein n=1 Tax=Stylosanthes scabra TaxID=79078 RepID=A0ABU6S5Y0_9FABA|nr:hypothetical protein [Stylosanthes scabra]
MGLEQLKAFILRSIGEHRRRVQKVYYRFPHDVDGIFHFKRSLNLDAMNQGYYGFQGGPDDDPIDEFEVGQQFDDKESVLMAVKTYSIRRAVEYKILESDRLKHILHRHKKHKQKKNNIPLNQRKPQLVIISLWSAKADPVISARQQQSRTSAKIMSLQVGPPAHLLI